MKKHFGLTIAIWMMVLLLPWTAMAVVPAEITAIYSAGKSFDMEGVCIDAEIKYAWVDMTSPAGDLVNVELYNYLFPEWDLNYTTANSYDYTWEQLTPISGTVSYITSFVTNNQGSDDFPAAIVHPFLPMEEAVALMGKDLFRCVITEKQSGAILTSITFRYDFIEIDGILYDQDSL